MKKQLVQKLIELLPSGLARRAILRHINVPEKFDSKLIFKVASTERELTAAFALVYKYYRKLGYVDSNPHALRASIYHALPTTKVLIVIHDGEVVGTLSLVCDSWLGLPLQSAFSLAEIKKNPGLIAEITSLVVDENFRRKNKGEVFLGLIKTMYQCAVELYKIRHLVISIHPKERVFYKALMDFRQIKGFEKNYYGAPAIAMALDLNQAESNYKKIYSPFAPKKNLYNFFVKNRYSNIKLAVPISLEKSRNPVTYLILKELFCKKLGLTSELSFSEKKLLLSFYKKSATQPNKNNDDEIEI